MAQSALFKSSIGKKFLMGLTGLFLISFLVIHAAINSMIWFNDGGETFSQWGQFHGNQPDYPHDGDLDLVAGFISSHR
jgi:succinate dehydrogenase / fumarate reductase cytochrome b subunit